MHEERADAYYDGAPAAEREFAWIADHVEELERLDPTVDWLEHSRRVARVVTLRDLSHASALALVGHLAQRANELRASSLTTTPPREARWTFRPEG